MSRNLYYLRLSDVPNIQPIIRILPIIGITNIRFLPIIENFILPIIRVFVFFTEYSADYSVFVDYWKFKFLLKAKPILNLNPYSQTNTLPYS
jgi:hypothetical protein